MKRFLFSKPYLKRVIRLLLICIGLYVSACGLLMINERRMVYVPFPGPTDPMKAGLPYYTAGQFTARDRTEIPYWQHEGASDAPILLYFHGNGGGLHAFIEPLAWLAAQQLHVVAMEYRGYPGAPGTPSEQTLVADAVDLFDYLRKRYPTRPIAIWGYSLGSGIAVQLAAARQPQALILEAPFSAIVDRAKQMFPLIPVHQLMKDQYRSREYIDRVHAPIFIMHGDADIIIPLNLGERLYARANQPKTFRTYERFGHLDLIDSPAYSDAVTFIRESTRRTPSE